MTSGQGFGDFSKLPAFQRGGVIARSCVAGSRLSSINLAQPLMSRSQKDVDARQGWILHRLENKIKVLFNREEQDGTITFLANAGNPTAQLPSSRA
jgi:hypothetical protein